MEDSEGRGVSMHLPCDWKSEPRQSLENKKIVLLNERGERLLQIAAVDADMRPEREYILIGAGRERCAADNMSTSMVSHVPRGGSCCWRITALLLAAIAGSADQDGFQSDICGFREVLDGVRQHLPGRQHSLNTAAKDPEECRYSQGAWEQPDRHTEHWWSCRKHCCATKWCEAWRHHTVYGCLISHNPSSSTCASWATTGSWRGEAGRIARGEEPLWGMSCCPGRWCVCGNKTVCSTPRRTPKLLPLPAAWAPVHPRSNVTGGPFNGNHRQSRSFPCPLFYVWPCALVLELYCASLRERTSMRACGWQRC